MAIFRRKILSLFGANQREEILEGIAELQKSIDAVSGKPAELASSLAQMSEQIHQDSRSSKEYISLEYLSIQPNPKKKNILICGYYGARNLGDELMLQALLKQFNPKDSEITIMLSDNFELDDAIYAPHKVIHYPRRSQDCLILAQKFDVMVVGGGAMIDDSGEYSYNNKEHYSLPYVLLSVAKAMEKKGGDVLFLGVSTNQELKNQHFIRDLQYVVNHSTYFSVRDTNSLKTLKLAGINTSKIALIDDLALTDIHPIQYVPNRNTIVIGLVYIAFTEADEKKLADFTSQIINTLPKSKKITLRFIPFLDYKNHDKHMYERIINLLPKAENISAEITDFPEDIDELLQIIAACSLVVSMRYHGVLVSTVTGIPTLCIDYSSKHAHYYNKIKYIKEHYSPTLIGIEYSDIQKDHTKKILQVLDSKWSPLSKQDFTRAEDDLKRIIKEYV